LRPQRHQDLKLAQALYQLSPNGISGQTGSLSLSAGSKRWRQGEVKRHEMVSPIAWEAQPVIGLFLSRFVRSGLNSLT
jgi:hypothetical protein